MGLADQIIEDMRFFSGNSEDFGVEITLISPDAETTTVNGFSTKHHLGLDDNGQAINSKKASVAFSEGNLADYSIRNSAQEIDLKDYRINVKDSTGIEKNYISREWFPDEKLGLIVVILTDYGSD